MLRIEFEYTSNVVSLPVPTQSSQRIEVGGAPCQHRARQSRERFEPDRHNSVRLGILRRDGIETVLHQSATLIIDIVALAVQQNPSDSV